MGGGVDTTKWEARDITILLAVVFSPLLLVMLGAMIRGYNMHFTKNKITETPEHQEDQT